MKKYFYFDGHKKIGPLCLDELNISSNTLIWFEGLDDWTPARNIEEMKPILELQPPPILSADEKKIIEPANSNDDNINNLKDTTNQNMFSSPFSFEGRIRRTEYGLSFIIFIVINTFLDTIVKTGESSIIGLSYIPLLWFLWAQGAKRCHDMGKSGWFQIIPFYVFWMIFANGESGYNKYGLNPKG